MKTSQSPATNSPNSATAVGTATSLGRTGLGTSMGRRLPVPPRERKPALAAVAVLLILGGALTSAYLVMISGRRVSAIQIAEPVAAGRQIPQSALREVQIGNTGIEFINWAERSEVTRAYAAVPLVKGALLTNAMVAKDTAATQGRVIVGLALKPGQLPAGGLQPGDRVSLYAVDGQNTTGVRSGITLATDAIVYSVTSGGEQSLQLDQTMVSVAVPSGQAPQVAQAASSGAVAVALIPPGTKVLPGTTTARTVPRQPPATGPGSGDSGREPAVSGGGQVPQPTSRPTSRPTSPTSRPASWPTSPTNGGG